MLAAGTTIAGYRIEGRIGAGGMGVVYEATQLSLGRTVALKVIAPHLSADAGFAERFRHEAMVQAGLEHPNVVPVHETGEAEEGLYLAMKLVRGPSLRQLILDGELSASRALRILAQAAAALDASHDAGLIHRDVKPQNILVDERDHAYLADFGLIKAVGGGGPTRTGQYLGTLDYVSPEQIRGEPLTPASDIYALAAVLYECLTGEVPFWRDTEAAMLYAHLSDPPPRLMERRAELPPALDAVIARGLAKQPSERYASASQLVADAQSALERALEALTDTPGPSGASLVPAAPVGVGAKGKDGAAADGGERARFRDTIVDPALLRSPPVIGLAPERPFPWAWAAALAGLALLLAVGGFLLGRSGDGRDPAATGLAVAGPLTLAFSTDAWKPEKITPRLGGLRFADPVALVATESGPTTRLVAGTVPAAEGALLLPPTFLARLRARPRPEAVRLGELSAFRYRGLRHDQLTGALTLYVVPTTRGVVTIACLRPEGESASALGRCEAVAATASLRGGRALALGPNVTYVAALRPALRRLNAARLRARSALRVAKTQARQARAASTLAAAARAAAARLRNVQPGPRERGAHRSVVQALEDAATGYRALARAVRAGNRRAYAKAMTAVKRAEVALRRGLVSLEKLGYTVGSKRL
jgi:Protein kinase domain